MESPLVLRKAQRLWRIGKAISVVPGKESMTFVSPSQSVPVNVELGSGQLCPGGHHLLYQGLELARVKPLSLDHEAYRDPKLRFFLSALAHMFRLSHLQAVFLSGRAVAVLMGVSPRTAARWISYARTEGVLRLEREANYVAREAARYSFHAENLKLEGRRKPKP
jgi:hypothetical protein